jgi:hypothetical protein
VRPNTPREQLLQNLLAMGSVLLFRSTAILAESSPAGVSLVVEIETWFTESQDAIKRELQQEYVVIPERRAERRYSPTDQSPWQPAIIQESSVIPIPKPENYFGL